MSQVVHEIGDSVQSFMRLRPHLRDENGMTFREFREQLRPRYAIVWAQILTAHATLWIAVAGFIALNRAYPSVALALCVPAALLFGYLLHYVGLYMHAAAHNALARDRDRNDLLANLTFGLLFAIHIKVYRAVHMGHHLLHGTAHDPENAYVQPLDWRFFALFLTGIRTVQKLLFNKLSDQVQPPAGYGWFRVLSLALHASFALGLVWFGLYAAAAAWAIAVVVFFPMCSDLRLVLEHRQPGTSPTATEHGAYTRMFRGWLLSRTFGGGGFDRHLLHHLDPAVPYERLPEFENYLRRCGGLGDFLDGRTTTYPATFTAIASGDANRLGNATPTAAVG